MEQLKEVGTTPGNASYEVNVGTFGAKVIEDRHRAPGDVCHASGHDRVVHLGEGPAKKPFIKAFIPDLIDTVQLHVLGRRLCTVGIGSSCSVRTEAPLMA